MITRTYQKLCDAGRLQQEIIDSGKLVSPSVGARFYGISVNYAEGGVAETNIFLFDDITQQEISEIDTLVTNHIPTPLPHQPDPKVDDSGKLYVRPETRPIDCTTIFTTRGDTLSPASIGTGNKVTWDASQSGEFSTDGAPSGFKQKVIDIVFCDPIYLSAGAIFFLNGSYGSYLKAEVIMPDTGQGEYELDHFVVEWPILGDAPSGSTIDSQTISSELPSGVIMRFTVVLPTDDVTSQGTVGLKIYRARTVVH